MLANILHWRRKVEGLWERIKSQEKGERKLESAKAKEGRLEIFFSLLQTIWVSSRQRGVVRADNKSEYRVEKFGKCKYRVNAEVWKAYCNSMNALHNTCTMIILRRRTSVRKEVTAAKSLQSNCTFPSSFSCFLLLRSLFWCRLLVQAIVHSSLPPSFF